MFADNEIHASPELMYEVYKEHENQCPMIKMIERWCGKKHEMIKKYSKESIFA